MTSTETKTNQNQKGRSERKKGKQGTMIAAIEWIPAGRANPNPSKYEYSRAEQEFLAQVVQAGELVGEEDADADGAQRIIAAANGDGDASSGSGDEDWEDVEDEDNECENGREENLCSGGFDLPKIEPSCLPADLRMDEYSEDEEKDIGDLLRLGEVCTRLFLWTCFSF